jgi:RimJ/RimL family protein N-acetyltransferase
VSLALADGSVVEVRPLRAADRRPLDEAIAALSPTTRYLRFASPTPRLGQRTLQQLVEIDHHRSEALLAIDPATRDGIGVGRFAEFADEPGVVDIGVTVTDAWQGRGLGPALLQRILDRARAEGHVLARASVLAVNVRSLRMAESLGFRRRAYAGPMIELELPLTD